MSFDSFDFALFLPIVFAIYWLLARRLSLQNTFILFCSYIFYGWWDWRFLGLIILTTLISYHCALRISAARTARAKRLWNTLNISSNLIILGFFKYCNFFIDSFAALASSIGLETSWPVLHIMLPVGISFYTFQALSYTIDVTKGTIQAERSLLSYATYLSFFPQLVAGPIERASHLLPQFLHSREFDYTLAVDGARRMLWGFFKKIAIADSCAGTVQLIFADYHTAHSISLIYGACLFALQIYADFSGYSDIAIGCAQLFGIRLNDNFRVPYFATGIHDFWRRWHISLTSWFRDYIYIPLGGNRCPKHRIIINTLIVFSLSGLWHGADWHFVLWGAYHGLLFIPGIITGRKHTGDGKITVASLLRMVFTFAFVSLGWIIFRADSIGMAFSYIGNIFTSGIGGIPPYSKNMLIPIAIMLLAEWRGRHMRHALEHISRHFIVRATVYYALLAICLWYSGQSTQFIYFQF